MGGGGIITISERGVGTGLYNSWAHIIHFLFSSISKNVHFEKPSLHQKINYKAVCKFKGLAFKPLHSGKACWKPVGIKNDKVNNILSHKSSFSSGVGFYIHFSNK